MKQMYTVLIVLLIFVTSITAQSLSLIFNSDANNNEFVSVTDANDFGLDDAVGSWTMEGWVKFNQVTNEAHLFRLAGQIFVQNGKLNIPNYSGGGYLQGATTLVTGTWYHIAYVRTPNSINVYLNGISELVDNSLDDGTTSDFRIGAYGSEGSYSFSGAMDEVRFWSVARSQAEIQNYKDTELSGNEAGLLVYYDFNNGSGSTVIDKANGNYNGTLHNMDTSNWGVETPISLTPNTPSKSLTFDGVNDYVKVGDANNFNLDDATDSWTMEGWFNFDQVSNEALLMRLAGQLLVNNNKLRIYDTDGTVDGSTTLSTGTWYHIAYVRTPNSINVYLNGNPEISTNKTDAGTTDEFRIGTYGGNGNYLFSGIIDEVRLWSVARTQAEIQAKKDKELSGDENNLLVYYDFNDETGYSVTDESNNDNDGLMYGMNILNWNSETPIPEVIPSKSLTFDGINDYVKVGDANNFNLDDATDSWTMEGWFNFDQVSNEALLMRLAGQLLVNNNKLRIYDTDGTVDGSTTLSTGTWYHIAYVRTPNSINVYLNGNPEISTNKTDAGTTDEFRIGTYGGNGNYLFSGIIDEVRFWTDARTQTEIQNNKDKELVGNESNLLIYYNFNDGNGNTVEDKSGNNYDGTLYNMSDNSWVDSSPNINGINIDSPPETAWVASTLPGNIQRPGYLESVYYLDYGVNITCISDYNEFNGIKAGLINSTHDERLKVHYSKDQPWNSDMSKLIVGDYYLLNANTFELEKCIHGIDGATTITDGKWAHTDPDIRYFCDGNSFYKMDIDADNVTLLHTFATYSTITIGLHEGNLSIDDKYVVLVESDGSKGFLYDIENNIKHNDKQFNNNENLDWITISPLGDYIVSQEYGTHKTYRYDTTFNSKTVLAPTNQHGDLALDANGDEVFVQVLDLCMFELGNPNTRIELIPAQYTRHIGGHISGRASVANPNMRGWAFVSADRDDNQTFENSDYHTELFEIKLDGSGTVRHFGHSGASILNGVYPMGCPRQDGKQIAFNSDWYYFGEQGNVGEGRAYIAEYVGGNNNKIAMQKNSKAEITWKLEQNYPNPFNPTTMINYTLSADGMIKLSVYNILGQEVKVLINEHMRAGSYSTPFNGSNLSSGVYFYKLQSGNNVQVKKMMLLK